jgi:hypothetical protein
MTVGDLAQRLGLSVEQLAGAGPFGMGTFVTATASVEYAWDVHHEHPVSSYEELARRELISYDVELEDGLRIKGPPKPETTIALVVARIANAGEDESFAIDPPVPALALLEALGCPEPVARTTDVHMSSWQIGPWTTSGLSLTARLAKPPAGERHDSGIPAIAAAQLAQDDVIGSIALTQPFGARRTDQRRQARRAR